MATSHEAGSPKNPDVAPRFAGANGGEPIKYIDLSQAELIPTKIDDLNWHGPEDLERDLNTSTLEETRNNLLYAASQGQEALASVLEYHLSKLNTIGFDDFREIANQAYEVLPDESWRPSIEDITTQGKALSPLAKRRLEALSNKSPSEEGEDLFGQFITIPDNDERAQIKREEALDLALYKISIFAHENRTQDKALADQLQGLGFAVNEIKPPTGNPSSPTMYEFRSTPALLQNYPELVEYLEAPIGPSISEVTLENRRPHPNNINNAYLLERMALRAIKQAVASRNPNIYLGFSPTEFQKATGQSLDVYAASMGIAIDTATLNNTKPSISLKGINAPTPPDIVTRREKLTKDGYQLLNLRDKEHLKKRTIWMANTENAMASILSLTSIPDVETRDRIIDLMSDPAHEEEYQEILPDLIDQLKKRSDPTR